MDWMSIINMRDESSHPFERDIMQQKHKVLQKPWQDWMQRSS